MGIRHIRHPLSRRVALVVCWLPLTVWFFVHEALRHLVWHAVALPVLLLAAWWQLATVIVPAATREAWRGVGRGG